MLMRYCSEKLKQIWLSDYRRVTHLIIYTVYLLYYTIFSIHIIYIYILWES